MNVIVKWGDVPEHILANAREGVYGTGRIVQDDYEMEIHENLLNTDLISKIVREACELSNEELDILIDRLRELYD